ncbi:MAG: hypothetical protein AAF211_25345, partial [Myxococcota bacterium]
FSADLDDPRYLPFEHRGAVSSWTFELAGATASPPRPQFDWTSTADLVLTIRYTARHDTTLASLIDDGQMRSNLNQLGSNSMPGQVAIALRHDDPNAFRTLLSNGTATVTLDFDRLPYVFQALDPEVMANVKVLLKLGPSVTMPPSTQITLGMVHRTLPAPPGDLPGPPVSATYGPSTPAALYGQIAQAIVSVSAADSNFTFGPHQQLTIDFTTDLGELELGSTGQLDPAALLDVVVLFDLSFASSP